MNAAAGGAAAAAAAKRRRDQEEEELFMKDDLPTDLEYKIVRSIMGSFKKRESLQQMLVEEARGGWELHEKLDDSRVRLRRHVDARANDDGLDFDPYRTHYGTTEAKLAMIIVGAIGLVMATGIMVALIVNQ